MCEPVPRSHVAAFLLVALMVASPAPGAEPGTSEARSSLLFDFSANSGLTLISRMQGSRVRVRSANPLIGPRQVTLIQGRSSSSVYDAYEG